MGELAQVYSNRLGYEADDAAKIGGLLAKDNDVFVSILVAHDLHLRPSDVHLDERIYAAAAGAGSICGGLFPALVFMVTRLASDSRDTTVALVVDAMVAATLLFALGYVRVRLIRGKSAVIGGVLACLTGVVGAGAGFLVGRVFAG